MKSPEEREADSITEHDMQCVVEDAKRFRDIDHGAKSPFDYIRDAVEGRFPNMSKVAQYIVVMRVYHKYFS